MSQVFSQGASLPEHSFPGKVFNAWFILSKVYAFTSAIKKAVWASKTIFFIKDRGRGGLYHKKPCLNLPEKTFSLPAHGPPFPIPSGSQQCLGTKETGNHSLRFRLHCFSPGETQTGTPLQTVFCISGAACPQHPGTPAVRQTHSCAILHMHTWFSFPF